jgi:hypothetical protein
VVLVSGTVVEVEEEVDVDVCGGSVVVVVDSGNVVWGTEEELVD